jgi:hypothetical protein
LPRVATRAHGNRLWTNFNLTRESREFEVILGSYVVEATESELLFLNEDTFDALMLRMAGGADLRMDEKHRADFFPPFRTIFDFFDICVVGFYFWPRHPASCLWEDGALFGGFLGLLLLALFFEDVEGLSEEIV